jgi:hypothetical protein
MYMACNEFVRNNTRFMQILGSFLFGISMTLSVIKLLCILNVIDINPKQYAYVDIEKIIESVNNSLSEQTQTKKISEEEVSAKLTLAKHKFDSLLKKYAHEHNAIIFSTTKAIAGASNETEYFLKQTLEEIK